MLIWRLTGMNLESLMQILNNNAVLICSQVTRSKTRLRPHPWHWRLWQNQLCVHLLFLQRVSLLPLTNLRGISWGEYILKAFVACKMCSCMRVKWLLLPSHYLFITRPLKFERRDRRKWSKSHISTSEIISSCIYEILFYQHL